MFCEIIYRIFISSNPRLYTYIIFHSCFIFPEIHLHNQCDRFLLKRKTATTKSGYAVLSGLPPTQTYITHRVYFFSLFLVDYLFTRKCVVTLILPLCVFTMFLQQISIPILPHTSTPLEMMPLSLALYVCCKSSHPLISFLGKNY